MAIEAKVTAKVEVSETPSLGLQHVANPTFTHKLNDGKQVVLDATSTPTASKVASGRVTLSSGAGVIDLTDLTGPSGDVSFNTLKPRVVQLSCPAANTHPVVITPAETNGYSLAGDEISIPPGGKMVVELADGAAAVGASAKDIDLASTHQTAVLDYLIVAG